MYRALRIAAITTILFTLACTKNDSHTNDNLDLYQADIPFYDRVKLLSGDVSKECVNSKNSKDTYYCISENFSKNMAFYVYHTSHGLDSVINNGVAYNGVNLYILYFDEINQNIYTGYECENPLLLEYQKGLLEHGPAFVCK